MPCHLPYIVVEGYSDMKKFGLVLSEAAAQRLRAIMESQAEAPYLRIAVEGGGCNGFQYDFSFTHGPQADDILVERDGAHVVVDPISAELMEGSTIDFTEELIGSSFKILNPKAKSACGCGTSFSL